MVSGTGSMQKDMKAQSPAGSIWAKIGTTMMQTVLLLRDGVKVTASGTTWMKMEK